jgi:hypothetical protein
MPTHRCPQTRAGSIGFCPANDELVEESGGATALDQWLLLCLPFTGPMLSFWVSPIRGHPARMPAEGSRGRALVPGREPGCSPSPSGR